MRKLLGTFFGIGWLPGWAGTYASAVTAALALAAHGLGVPLWGVAAAAVLVTGLSIWAGQSAEKIFTGKDPRPFVLDEVAGMLIAALPLWLAWNRWAWASVVIAFFWFRVTDILKPPPVRQAERLPGGWGITLDDVLAGAMAFGLTLASQAILNRLIPS